MKKKFLKLGSFVIAGLLALPSILPIHACTGVIVGGDLTKDGTTIFGRTEDLEVNHNKAYKVHTSFYRIDIIGKYGIPGMINPLFALG